MECGHVTHKHFNDIANNYNLQQRWHNHVRNHEVTAAVLQEKFPNCHARFEYQRGHKDVVAFIERGGGRFLTTFHGWLAGVWQPLFDNEQMIALLVNHPTTHDFNSHKPWDGIFQFKDICAKGWFLQLFNSSVDMRVSDDQGNSPTIPHQAQTNLHQVCHDSTRFLHVSP